MNTHGVFGHSHVMSMEHVPFGCWCSGLLSPLSALPARSRKVLKNPRTSTPDVSPSAKVGSETCVHLSTEIHSTGPMARVVSIKGSVIPDLLHARFRELYAMFQAPLPLGLSLSLQNSVFLSTEHSKSAQGETLSRVPRKCLPSQMGRSHRAPPASDFSSAPASAACLPSRDPGLGPRRRSFASTRDRALCRLPAQRLQLPPRRLSVCVPSLWRCRMSPGQVP